MFTVLERKVEHDLPRFVIFRFSLNSAAVEEVCNFARLSLVKFRKSEQWMWIVVAPVDLETLYVNVVE
ncbi:MAG: hypothetical protein WDO15_13655 [Bacteroidota bacterium]